MKTSTFISLLAAATSAAPLEKRDESPAHAHGGMDMSKIGDLMKGMDMSKIGDLMKGVDMSKIGDLMKGVDMSKIGDLMKGVDLSKLPLPAGLPPIDPKVIQQYAGAFMGGAEKQKAFKIEELKPLLRPNAKRIKIIYGPYKLKGSATTGKVGNGFSMDPSGTGYSYAVDKDFPTDITVIDVKSGVFDEEYNPIDIGKGLYNHHNVFFDAGGSTPGIVSCGKNKVAGGMPMGLYTMPMAIFIGGATESTGLPYTSMDGKFNSGYYLKPDTKVSMMLDVVNYNKEDKTVYTISELEYLPGKIADALPATSQVIDIGMCAGKTGMFVHPPAGVKQWAINGTDITITKAGTFLNGKAHLHDGGVDMTVFLNDKPVCTSKALYGGVGHSGTMPGTGEKWEGISGTSVCEDIIVVKPGDRMRFDASFDVAAHPEREQESHGEEMGMAEGMALFTGSFALAAGQ